MNLGSRIGILAIALAALSASAAYAQNVNPGLDLSLSTPIPSPGQHVTVTAKSYSFDADAATITWTAGGKRVARGAGVTSIDVIAPASGKTLVVDADAVTADGTTYSAEVTIAPSSVDLVVESSGFVPPLFSGKAPVAFQNSVKVVAMPHLANSRGVEYDPTSLVYKWQLGDSALENASGYGKQSVTIQGPIIPRAQLVTVAVSTRDGSARGEATVSIPFTSPTLVFYRNDPLYGSLYNAAIGDTLYIGEQRESGVIAVPYGFDAPMQGIGGLTLSWAINGTAHPELSVSKTVTLRAPEGQSGASTVDLTVSNDADILQRSTGNFSVQFTSDSAQ